MSYTQVAKLTEQRKDLKLSDDTSSFLHLSKVWTPHMRLRHAWVWSREELAWPDRRFRPHKVRHRVFMRPENSVDKKQLNKMATLLNNCVNVTDNSASVLKWEGKRFIDCLIENYSVKNCLSEKQKSFFFMSIHIHQAKWLVKKRPTAPPFVQKALVQGYFSPKQFSIMFC